MTPLPLRTFTLATVLKVLAGTVVALLLLWYAGFQARLLIAGPQVTIDSLSRSAEGQQVTVEGHARNAVEITLNGRAITVDETGAFTETLVLPPGYTIMEVHAKDRYGRTQTIERDLVYTTS